MKQIRRLFFYILFAYFAGAISMLLFLVPGRIRYRDLFDEDKKNQMIDFDVAADRIENVEQTLIALAQKGQRFVEEQTSSQNKE